MATAQQQAPIGVGREPRAGWINTVRAHMLSTGMEAGTVTSANAAYFSKKRPHLEGIVDAASCTRRGGRKDFPLGEGSKTNIMAVLGSIDTPDAVLLYIARQLTLISKNGQGNEVAAGEMVMAFGDIPGLAVLCARSLSALSTLTIGNKVAFSELVMRVLEVSDGNSPLDKFDLLRKVTRVMGDYNVPAITCNLLDRSASAPEAIGRLERLFPSKSGGVKEKRVN